MSSSIIMFKKTHRFVPVYIHYHSHSHHRIFGCMWLLLCELDVATRTNGPSGPPVRPSIPRIDSNICSRQTATKTGCCEFAESIVQLQLPLQRQQHMHVSKQ